MSSLLINGSVPTALQLAAIRADLGLGTGDPGGINGVALLDGIGDLPAIQLPNNVSPLGPYNTIALLEAAFPAASNPGKTAYVGTSSPYTQYVSNGSAGVNSWKPVSTYTYASDGVSLIKTIGPNGRLVNPNGFATLFTGQQFFFGFGDSITADGGRIIGADGSVDVNVYQYCWPRYAEFSSNGCAQWGGSFAQAGYTIPQLKSDWLPRLIQYAPVGSAVVVLMGQNNAGVTDSELSDYTYCIDTMINAGLIPVLCLQTAGTLTRSRQRLHNHIAKLSFSRNLHIADLHSATVDPVTGVLLTSLSRDLVHPNQLGDKALGEVVGPILQKIFLRKTSDIYLAKHDLDYGPNRTTQTGGTTNPLFQSSNAGSPDIPAGWGFASGSFTGAFTYAAASKGRACTLNAPASGEVIARNSSANTIVPGDKCILSMVLTQTVSAGGYIRFMIMNSAGAGLYDAGRNNAQGGGVNISRSPVVIPFTHSGANGVLVDFVANGVGSSVTLEQFSIINLTALGFV